jgi:anti-sigma factor RsiW
VTCTEAEPLIGASLDGELDALAVLQLDAHVSGCSACAALSARLARLHEAIQDADLDWSSDVDLRPLAASIRRRRGGASWWRGRWFWAAALSALATVAVLAVMVTPRRTGTSIERQVVDNHVRSLMADHLVDVPSSDRHTVKPWFQGKLSFAPNVPDLTAEGFALAGGRLDVIDGKQAAALVYKRRQHVVNLWIMPADGPDRALEENSLEGFNLLRWQKDGTAYWAVSDLNPSELREFASLIRAH